MYINYHQQTLLTELEHSLQYVFNNRELLVEAISHPSLKQQARDYKIKDYQRLEFLGDAILGFVISELIYHKHQDEDEGNLAKIKAYLVCKNTICCIAEKIDLARYILMTEGEELSNGRNNQNNIENTMEALIAAIYLDGGIRKIESIINNLWREHIEQKFDSILSDPKTALQEWSQSKTHQKPIYRVIKQEGAAHAPIFTVEVHVDGMSDEAKGHTVKAAEKAAALGLLNIIKKQDLL